MSNSISVNSISVTNTRNSHEVEDTRQDASNSEGHTELAQVDGGRLAALNLLACCVMQLPVWGFPISYGIFQEYYTNPTRKAQFGGDISSTGTIGTTLNGIIYLSLPGLFGLLANRFAHLRKHIYIAGALISALSMLGSAFATTINQLVLTQGVLQAFGSAFLYSASTIYIDEWYIRRKGFAYGVMLSSKSAVGVVLPLAFSSLLSHIGYRHTIFAWTAILAATTIPAFFLLRPRVPINIPPRTRSSWRGYSRRATDWSFVKHRTFPTFVLIQVLFSMSYGIPNTYLSAFAASQLHFTSDNAALMLVAMNLPSIAASLWFGSVSDGESSHIFGGRRLSIHTVSFVSVMGSCMAIFLLWGMVPSNPYGAGFALLTLFSMIYGFFAGGNSATWGGIVKEVSKEAERRDEFVNTALLFGLMNGSRGVGYITGGLLSVKLLNTGPVSETVLAYGSKFGSMIMFSGWGAALCGLGVLTTIGRARV